MAERYVFLVDLAVYLKRDRGSVHDFVQRRGIKTVRLRRPNSGLSALAVSAEDAKRMILEDTETKEIVRPEDLMK